MLIGAVLVFAGIIMLYAGLNGKGQDLLDVLTQPDHVSHVAHVSGGQPPAP